MGRPMGSGGGANGAGGGGGGAKPTNVSKKKNQSKTNCVVCKSTTNKVPSNREGAVQCGVCDCWWHPKCALLSTEKFEMIAKWTEDGSQSPWKCQSCDSAGAKLLKMVTVLSSRVGDNENKLAEQAGRMDRVEDKSKLQDTRIDCQGKEIKELREQLAKLGELGGPSVVREMDERALKENNLVFHRVLEAGVVEARGRIQHDMRVLQQVLNELGLEVGVEQDTKFVRRLGPRTGEGVGEEEEGRDPRPLLVGFLHRHHTELILENCWKLSDSEDPGMRAVSVVKDLTMRQRAGEKDLHREAARKNCTRSQEDIEGNLAFKIVGRRGAKREILAPLRDGESISTEGEVIWNREVDSGVARGRRMARGGRRLGSLAATYPNCLAVGIPGGGTTMGQSRVTAQQQTAGQGMSTPGGRGGGRGRGVEPNKGAASLGRSIGGGSRDNHHEGEGREEMSTPRGRGGGRGWGAGLDRGTLSLGRSGGGGSRDHYREGERREWHTVGRGGSTRARDMSRSPQGGGCPPGKKVDSRTSPVNTYTKDYPNLIELSPNKYVMPGREDYGDSVEEVEDDAEVVQ